MYYLTMVLFGLNNKQQIINKMPFEYVKNISENVI